MRIELESSLQRWVEAQLLDARQAERIRAFEVAEAPAQRARWPVIVALAFGGIMLATGILLFVSAHWEDLSPFQRMSLLVRRWADSTQAARSRSIAFEHWP